MPIDQGNGVFVSISFFRSLRRVNVPTLLESRMKERESKEDMENEADSGRNPKTHGTRESKEAEKANGMGEGV